MIKLIGALAAIGIGLLVLVVWIDVWTILDALIQIYVMPLLECVPTRRWLGNVEID
jgi:hypothetical protein